RREGAGQRRDTYRLYVRDSYRNRRSLQRRKSQRQDGAAEVPTEKRRHGRDYDLPGPGTAQGLVEVRQDAPGEDQDQTLAPDRRSEAQPGARQAAPGEGTAPA